MTELSANAELHDDGEHIEHFDPVANKMGFWLFLFTEVLLFGMLFLAFAIYLSKYAANFRACSGTLDVPLGGTNTLILLTSSLTMALAIQFLQRSMKAGSIVLMVLTIACAIGFCVIKYFEWTHKFEQGIYPNSKLLNHLIPSLFHQASTSTLAAQPQGNQLFFGLYYTMTGFHALHVIVGSTLILLAIIFVAKGKVHKDRLSYIENTGLFWHLVDLVWIFLFPLFYLIG